MTPARYWLLSALPGLVTVGLILGGAYVLNASLEAAREAQQGLRTSVVQLQGAVQALDVQITARTTRLDETSARLNRLADAVAELTAAISTPAGE